MDFEFKRLSEEGKEVEGLIQVLIRTDGDVTIRSAEGIVLLMILKELQDLRAALGKSGE